MIDVRYTGHAALVIAERKIETRWIEAALVAPARVEKDLLHPTRARHFLRIAENGDRWLRVVVE